jgi:hypothetical protein
VLPVHPCELVYSSALMCDHGLCAVVLPSLVTCSTLICFQYVTLLLRLCVWLWQFSLAALLPCSLSGIQYGAGHPKAEVPQKACQWLRHVIQVVVTLSYVSSHLWLLPSL